MTATFSGRYTQNNGEDYAAGTVAITPYGGSTITVTLDSTGAYTTPVTLVLSSVSGVWLDTDGNIVTSPPPSGIQIVPPGGTVSKGRVRVVETITGKPVTASVYEVADGQSIDTGRDVGTVLGGADAIPPGTYVATSGSNPALSNPDSLRFTGGGSTQVTVRTTGDHATRGDGMFNLQHAGDGDYIFHLSTSGSGGAAIGIGVGAVSGAGASTLSSGLLIDNYSTGKGFLLQNLSSITSATAYGMYGVNNSTVAPLVRLVNVTATCKPVMQFVGGPAAGATGNIVEFLFNAGASTAGVVDQLTGNLIWNSAIINSAGAPSLQVINTGVNPHTWKIDNSNGIRQVFYSYSGTPNQWYGLMLQTSADALNFRAANAGAAQGAETYQTIISIQAGNKLGFHGTAATTKQTLAADATDLASVIALANDIKAKLVAKGLAA